MNYCKIATKLIISSACIYMFEKLIINVPYFIQVKSGSYTNILPQASIFNNIFIPIFLILSIFFYILGLYKELKK